MGFSNGAYAKVWEVKQVSDTLTSLRISISTKDKQTGQYEQRFGGFVSCLGTAMAAKARSLQPGDRIRLDRVDVENRYDKQRNVTYTNFNIWAFEVENQSGGVTSAPDHGEPPAYEEDDRTLPF